MKKINNTYLIKNVSATIATIANPENIATYVIK